MKMKNEKTNLFIGVGGGYVLDQLFKYQMINHYCPGGIEKTDFLTTQQPDFLCQKDTKKSEGYYVDRLNSIKYNKKFRIIYLVRSMAALLYASCSIIGVLYKFLLDKSGTKEEKLLNILNVRYKDIKVGDTVCSTYLRNEIAAGILSFNSNLLFEFWKSIFKLFIFDGVITSILKKHSYDQKIFFCAEYTYLQEAYRRLLLAKGFQQIIYSREKSSFRIPEKPLYGYEIYNNENYSDNINESEMNAANKYLEKITKREITFDYMKDCDVETNLHLTNADIVQEKKIAVIYMHFVSDAQYVTGTDCFIDMDHWLKSTIKILSDLNVISIIKIHPTYFKSNRDEFHHGDINYLEKLSKEFGLNLFEMNENVLNKTSSSNVYFISHKVSTLEISKIFPASLAITHHGTVAIESAFLGHQVICSEASMYSKNDTFVHLYSKIEQYRNIIKLWQSGQLSKSDDDLECLLKFICRKKMHSKRMFYIADKLAELFQINQNVNRSLSDDMNRSIKRVEFGSVIYNRIEKIFQQAFQ